MDENREAAEVIQLKADGVVVKLLESEGCKSCVLGGVCNKNSKTFFVKTSQSFANGDKVQVEVKPSVRVFSSFVVFILPVLVMLGSYGLAKIFLTESTSVLVAILSLPVSFVIIKAIDKTYKDSLTVKITKETI